MEDSERPANSRSAPLFFLLLGLAFSIVPIVNSTRASGTNKDYTLWFDIGNRLQAGEPLYQLGDDGEVRYMYPPTLAVLVFYPLSLCGPVAFVAILTACNSIAWILAISLSIRLVTGRWLGHSRYLYAVPSLAVVPYIWDTYLLGQVNLFLLVLVLGSFLALRNKRGILAGLLLGLAIAIKVFPLPVVIYFLFRKQWLAALATIASCVLFLAVAPGAIRGFERNGDELRQWVATMVGDQSGNTMAARSHIGFTRRNQSLVSLSHRWLRPVDAGDRDGVPFRINVADVTPRTAQLVGYGSCLALAFLFLWAARGRMGRNLAAEGIEAGMVCTLVVLVSPLSWTYFFCWLLPAWTTTLYYAMNPARSRKRIWVGIALAGVLFASAFTEQIDPLLQAYGVTALGAVVLFLVQAVILRDSTRDTEPKSTR